MPKFYDITPKVSERLAVFPGDQKFERKVAMSWPKGDHLELSAILSTLHLGAHADAPSHYHREGQDIAARSVGYYMGKAQVIRVEGLSAGKRVQVADLGNQPIQAPRVLFWTGSFVNPERWNGNFNSLSPELLDYLSHQGVRLVGLDTPSVDPADDKVLPAHHTLYKNDMAVLEGLTLEEVPSGVYTLVALPLRLEGAEASPVRAVLLPYVPEFPELV